MSTYQSAAEAAADIRKAYKLKGWTGRDISVKSDTYSGGSSINIVVKNPVISLAEAKRIAEDQNKERIHRDHFGEILGGANRFVSVRVSDEALKAKAAPYLEAVKSGVSCLPEHPTNTLQPIGHGYLVGRGNHGLGFALWGDGFICDCWDAQTLAEALALAVESGRRWKYEP